MNGLATSAPVQMPFEVHNNLVLQLIERQAPSLAKGVLELVMNSSAANAGRFDVSLQGRRLVVWDDGRGVDEAEGGLLL